LPSHSLGGYEYKASSHPGARASQIVTTWLNDMQDFETDFQEKHTFPEPRIRTTLPIYAVKLPRRTPILPGSRYCDQLSCCKQTGSSKAMITVKTLPRFNRRTTTMLALLKK
jgi:hypothetical protein